MQAGTKARPLHRRWYRGAVTEALARKRAFGASGKARRCLVGYTGGGGDEGLGGVLDGEHVGAHFVPLAEDQAVGGEVAADFGGVPLEYVFENGDEDAHGVVAEDGALGDAGNELGFADGDGAAVVLVDVHHDGEIGAAVAHVDDVVVGDAEGGANFLEDGDFAPAGGGANDGIYFAGGFLIAEARAENMVRRDDAF